MVNPHFACDPQGTLRTNSGSAECAFRSMMTLCPSSVQRERSKTGPSLHRVLVMPLVITLALPLSALDLSGSVAGASCSDDPYLSNDSQSVVLGCRSIALDLEPRDVIYVNDAKRFDPMVGGCP